MKTKDQLMLESIYGEMVEEAWGSKTLKGLAAVAALGTSGLHGAPDADRENPAIVSPAPSPTPSNEMGPNQKAKIAYNKILGDKSTPLQVKLHTARDSDIINNIVGDEETSKKYIIFLLTHGQQIPPEIGHKYPNIVKELKGYYFAKNKN